MKKSGPQIVDPVSLLCKPDGRYEILPGEGHKRLMALKLAGYQDAVADICVPKAADVEVRAENVDQKEPPQRTDAPDRSMKPAPEQKEEKIFSKEEGQTVNPTMARTQEKGKASGHRSERSSDTGKEMMRTIDDPHNRPSVRKELEQCKRIADKHNAARQIRKAAKAMPRTVKPKPKL